MAGEEEGLQRSGGCGGSEKSQVDTTDLIHLDHKPCSLWAGAIWQAEGPKHMLTHMDRAQLGSTQTYRKTQAGWQGQNLRQRIVPLTSRSIYRENHTELVLCQK